MCSCVRLLDQEADTVWSAIERKRASYKKPPRTMAEFCALLSSTAAPGFSSRLLEIDAAERD